MEVDTVGTPQGWEVYEFSVSTSTHDALKRGVTAVEWRKVLVATDRGYWDAYQTALDIVWRGHRDDHMVTAVLWCY